MDYCPRSPRADREQSAREMVKGCFLSAPRTLPISYGRIVFREPESRIQGKGPPEKPQAPWTNRNCSTTSCNTPVMIQARMVVNGGFSGWSKKTSLFGKCEIIGKLHRISFTAMDAVDD